MINKQSITYKMTLFLIILVIGQSLVFTSVLIIAGVLKESETNAINTFEDKVSNRRDYIQREMRNRWTNMDAYLDIFSKDLLSYAKKPDQNFLNGEVDTLIEMLRTTMATGAYIILESDSLYGDHDAIYIRDYDPILNDQVNNDLYLVAGDNQISLTHDIPMDGIWRYHFNINEENGAFFEKPYNLAPIYGDARALGYWSKPFSITPEDAPVITYSLPLTDQFGKLYGVIGIEISLSYLAKFMPATDLMTVDAMGYMIGYSDEVDTTLIYPMVSVGALQKRLFNLTEAFEFEPMDASENVFKVLNHKASQPVYASVSNMKLYNFNTPYDHEKWYLIGLMPEAELLTFVNKIRQILMVSILISLFLGGLSGFFMSYRFTKPIKQLARTVRHQNPATLAEMSYEKTGLKEIDELTQAIEIANANVVESSIKLSRIIDLLDIAIGAYEYSVDDHNIFVTDKLTEMLYLDIADAKVLYSDKMLFIAFLESVFANKVEEEDDIYKVPNRHNAWVKIKQEQVQGRTIGIVLDATEEILDKQQIMMDRDYDSLTKLLNRDAFQKQVESVLVSDQRLPASAFMMLDLDFLKEVNDIYGHQWGDRYIETTAEHLMNLSQDKLIVGRRSGDEFYLLLYGQASQKDIYQKVDAFYKALKEAPLKMPDGKMRTISISGGLVMLQKEIYAFEELTHLADEWLYKAKRSGKGKYLVYRDKDK
jgi:diguanylate cyclase (GGDEF)-like protein